MKYKILIANDNEGPLERKAQLMKRHLIDGKSERGEIVKTMTIENARDLIDFHGEEIVAALLDHDFTEERSNGFELVEVLRQKRPDLTRVAIVTGARGDQLDEIRKRGQEMGINICGGSNAEEDLQLLLVQWRAEIDTIHQSA